MIKKRRIIDGLLYRHLGGCQKEYLDEAIELLTNATPAREVFEYKTAEEGNYVHIWGRYVPKEPCINQQDISREEHDERERQLIAWKIKNKRLEEDIEV